jgi:hypothetical protein
VQKRVERSGTDPVTVPCQLFGHAESKDRFFDGVVQHVKPDQAGV